MTQFSNAMEIFKLLDKSNCRKCNEKTCLAFASKVFLGQKKLDQCPSLPKEVLARYGAVSNKQSLSQIHQEKALEKLKEKIKTCDLRQAAQRTGGIYSDGHLVLRILGKPFAIDKKAQVHTDLHVNHWIIFPVLEYILQCRGVPLTQKWIPFRELKGGREKNGLFVQRTETAFRQTADLYPRIFEDLIDIFNGKKADNFYDSDISLVLHPLPKVPILVCYWKSEGGMDSDLHLFFDSSADDNAGIDIVYTITAGIVTMFEKISRRHGSGIV